MSLPRYSKLSPFGKNLFILLCIALVGALISVAFIFLDNIGVLLGWLLGSAVNIFAYVTMEKGASYMLDPSTEAKGGGLMVVGAIGRFVLYAGALVLAGFASFRWGSLAHGYCNLISCALALMPNWIVLVFASLHRTRKEAKQEEKEKQE